MLNLNYALLFVNICMVLSWISSCAGKDDASRLGIYNGQSVQNDVFDSVMEIGRLYNGEISFFCSGVFIGERLLVTAAHCLQYKNATPRTIEKKDTLRSPQILRIKSRHNRIYTVSKFYLEPYVKQTSLSIFFGELWGLDLAIIKLDQDPTEKAATIADAATEPTAAGLSTRESLVITGYASKILEYGQVPFARSLETRPASLVLGRFTPDSAAVCPGDSGGGTFVARNDGYHLRAINTTRLPLWIDAESIDYSECSTGFLSVALDLTHQRSIDFLSRAKLALSVSEQDVNFHESITPFNFPTLIEAELFHGSSDYTPSNQGNYQLKNGLQHDVDLFKDESTDTTYVGNTEVGETLNYWVKGIPTGTISVTIRARNIHPTMSGRLAMRFGEKYVDIKLTQNTMDWQTVTTVLAIYENNKNRVGVEILEGIEFDWFKLEAANL